MKTGAKCEKKICKNSHAGRLKKSIYEKMVPGPVFAGYFPLVSHGNSDKESSHDVGKSYLRRC